MTFETYYPEQRQMAPLAALRRDRVLPEGATGQVEVARGAKVDLRTVIVRGAAPAPYLVIDAVKSMRLRRASQLDDLLMVAEGDPVDINQLLAGRSGRGRHTELRAPVSGRVRYIGEGRILLQEDADPIIVEAGMSGQVVTIRRGRGALVEAIGAVAQGVWGNERRALGTLRAEPEDGLERIHTDALDAPMRGAIIITRRALTEAGLRTLEEQDIVGVIAPSMSPDLIGPARAQRKAVLLTEGFGGQRMNAGLYNFLADYQGRQGTIDAASPGLLEARRPEVIISVPVTERPPAPQTEQRVQMNQQVRLTRGLHAGSAATITALPRSPVRLDTGLRLPCAQVQLVTGESLFVPLANLELFG